MRTIRVSAIALGIVFGAAASRASNTLTVVVFDFARTPHELLASATREARHAFRAAGIETEWILCHPLRGCSVPDNYVQVKIFPRPLANPPASIDGMASTMTCSVTEHCAASYVYYDRVIAFAESHNASINLTLGYVMVHEIGHLMGLRHTPGGIMAAVFTSQDLRNAASGWLCFAADDVRELRAAVARSLIASTPARTIRLPGRRTDIAE
jgi:hypothetical protein